ARRAEAQAFREAEREAHADGHALAVQQARRVAGPGLERVAEGVAEIEERAVASLVLVARDDGGLGLDAHLYGGDERLLIEAENAVIGLLQPSEEARVAEEAVLRDLGIAGAHLAHGKSLQDVR